MSMTRLSHRVETTTPPKAGTAPPLMPVPRSRGTSGIFSASAQRNSSTICSSFLGLTTAQGMAARRLESAP